MFVVVVGVGDGVVAVVGVVVDSGSVGGMVGAVECGDVVIGDVDVVIFVIVGDVVYYHVDDVVVGGVV